MQFRPPIAPRSQTVRDSTEEPAQSDRYMGKMLTPRIPKYSALRSRVTNGKLPKGIDARSAWARRLNDLIATHIADLGGEDAMSQSKLLLIKSAANSAIVLEQMEVEFSKKNGASFQEMLAYMSILNSLRRTFETLGLDRSATAPRTSDWSQYDLGLLDKKDAYRCSALIGRWELMGAEIGYEAATELWDLLQRCKIKPHVATIEHRRPDARPR
jgi:hypothetical protein